MIYNRIYFGRWKKGKYYSYYYSNKYGSLHKYIWEEKNGKVPKGFIIHHADENPMNNNINNLEILSRGKHAKLHHINKKVKKITRVKSGKNQPTSIKLKCIETNKEYYSISQAERETGITTIKQWYQGRQKTAGGFHWEVVA